MRPCEKDEWAAACQEPDESRAVIDNSSRIGFSVGVRVPEYSRICVSLPRNHYFLPKSPVINHLTAPV